MQHVKPAYTSSLAMVKPNEVVPETLLLKLCTENPRALGMAVREPSGIVIDKYPKLDTPEKNFEFMKKIMEGRKKFPAMFTFHDFPPEFDEDEVQPFIPLRDSKGNPLLAVGIEGDFPNHVDTSADGFSEAYMLMYDWLGPKIEAMYKLVGNNPSKIFEYLNSEQFRSDVNQTIGHRGVLTFLPSVGNPFVIASTVNELGVEGTWGEASNSYGYTEAVIEAATPEPKVEKPAPKALSANKYASDDPPPPAPKVDSPKVEPAPVTLPAQKVANEILEEVVEHKPPANLHGKPLKAWYRTLTGDLPKNWADKPSVKVMGKKAAEPNKTPKDMKAPEPKIVGETMPIISGDMQKRATDMIKKHLGDGSAIIDDPNRASEDEKKLATFSQLMGMKHPFDILKWRTSFVFAFTKANPETAALAIIELRSYLKDSEKKLGELTSATTTTTPATSAPTVSSKPEPAKVAAPRNKYA